MSAVETDSAVVERTHSGLFLVVVAVALLASIGGLIWSYTLSGRLAKSEAALTAAQERNDHLAAALHETDARLSVATDTLGKSVGLTQRQLETRAQDLLRRQQADSKRLEGEQAEARQQIGAVTGEVSTVKTDVGAVKTDVAKTQTDLQATQTQLQSMKGDMGVQSGLIATTHDELEILKHKGDRNLLRVHLEQGRKAAAGLDRQP